MSIEDHRRLRRSRTSPLAATIRRMSLQIRQLLRNLRRKVRLEAVIHHDFFCGSLQIEMRRVGVVHELPGTFEMEFRLPRAGCGAGSRGG